MICGKLIAIFKWRKKQLFILIIISRRNISFNSQWHPEPSTNELIISWVNVLLNWFAHYGVFNFQAAYFRLEALITLESIQFLYSANFSDFVANNSYWRNVKFSGKKSEMRIVLKFNQLFHSWSNCKIYMETDSIKYSESNFLFIKASFSTTELYLSNLYLGAENIGE